MTESSPSTLNAPKKLSKWPPLTRLEYALAAATLSWVIPLFSYLVVEWRPIVAAVMPLLKKEPAAWAQAVFGVLAIMASAGIAIWIQRRDHRHQLRGPIEVAHQIVRYSQLAILKARQEIPSLEALHEIGNGNRFFDLAGMQATAKSVTDIPVFELRNADAARHMMSLAHTMRQFEWRLSGTIQQYRTVDSEAFTKFHTHLDSMFEVATRTRAGLEEVLTEVRR